MDAIDFSALDVRRKTYGGANGEKFAVMLDGERYMLKFPAPARRNVNMSYSNSSFSEHLGCRIFDAVGIPVQRTRLGKYVTPDGAERVGVACKDFTSPGVTLQDFGQLKNTIFDSDHHGYGTDLVSIMETIDNQTLADPELVRERFWDMFIVDALIGNWDRHNGNWGFLYNETDDSLCLAPVFDCGSSLFPQADDSIMQATLSSQAERDLRTFEIPLSIITMNGRKLKYFDFISSLANADCNAALARIVPRIDMSAIERVIEETPLLSNLQKDFYGTMLWVRKDRILDYSLAKLQAGG